ncbi:hypothetical protein BH09ACT12_BH09ACT12_33020 [soil metagenome]
MLGTLPLHAPLSGVLTRLREWPITAQQQARRNAMVAATACAQRRIEREEVADFLRSHDRPAEEHAATQTPAPGAARARAHG